VAELSPGGKGPGRLDAAFADALDKQREQRLRHQQDLDELGRLAEEGRRAGRRAALIAGLLAAVLLLVLLVIMLKDPASRGVSILLLFCLGLVGAFKLWKGQR
jgi:hypothetical protein